MTDKELLKNAAKAAGIKNHAYYSCPFNGSGINTGEVDEPLWNPLIDDGDALRLAVKLKIDVAFYDDAAEAIYYKKEVYGGWGIEEPNGNDPYASIRRAIVRAAAEIGKTL